MCDRWSLPVPLAIAGATQVRAQDLRRRDFRPQIRLQPTQNVIRAADRVPQAQPLAAGERGRLGDTPPRASQRSPAAAPTTGQAPSGQQPQRQQQGEQQQPPPQQGRPQEQGLQKGQQKQEMPTQQQGRKKQEDPQQQGRSKQEDPRTQGRGSEEQQQQQGRTKQEDPRTQGRGSEEQRQQQGRSKRERAADPGAWLGGAASATARPREESARNVSRRPLLHSGKGRRPSAARRRHGRSKARSAAVAAASLVG